MMKRYKIFGWLLLGAILVLGTPVSAQSFDALKWQNRVLVLSADENSPQVLEQIALLRDYVPEMEERELIVLQLTSQVLRKVDDLSPFPYQTRILENGQERRYLETLFSRDVVIEGELSVTLVGLDGEIKEFWSGVVEPSEIFDVIDAMPMRQREIDAQ
ncbi:MAG: DUF4174 domain-containing protein [Alphaproteobacteria bacterium]|nr:DUF4174 domain-containing protein [Alphaproteobacteria bacterium]